MANEISETLNKPLSDPLKMDVSKITTQAKARTALQEVGALKSKAEAELEGAKIDLDINRASEQAKAASQIADQARDYVKQNTEKESQYPYPEFHPTKDNAESLGGLFSIVSTIGLMLGSSGKQAGLNAMSAMTGMMQGWQKGRADLFKREKEEFDKEFNRIKVLRDDLKKDLDTYMKLLPYDKEAAMYKASEMSAKAGRDSIVSKYMETGRYKDLYSLISSIDKSIEKKEELVLRRREVNQANYQYFTDKDGKVHYINTKNPRDFGVVQGMMGDVTKLGTVPKEKGLPKKGEPQAKFVGETIGRPVDVDTAGKLVSGLSYIDGLKKLQDKSVSLGNAPGITVGLANVVNSFLKPELNPATGQQTIDVTQEALNDAWQKAQSDKSFTSLSEKSKVMAKAELDTIMLNLQTKYGNRAPVAEFRAAQQVLSRRSADPVAFQRTMNEEIQNTQKRIIDLGFDKKEVDKMGAKVKERLAEFDESPAPTSSAGGNIDPVTGFPKISDKGWTLMPDGQGRYAYISPNGIKKINAGRSSEVTQDEIEELE